VTKGRVRCNTGTTFAVVLGVAVLVAFGCGAPDTPWNVLVLVPDTVRGDHLRINGYSQETSPTIDALAREGANFTQAITAAPRTWQSFSSILTGLYPPRHGVRYIFDDPIAADTPMIASVLAQRGYETAAFDTGDFLERMTGEVGFGEFVRPRSRKDERRPDEILIEKVSDWIARERSAPFFAFVRMSGAHWPYVSRDLVDASTPCEANDHGFNSGSYGIEAAGPGEGVRLRDEEAFRKLIWTVDFDDATLRHMIAHYDSGIRSTDALIGRLVDRMRSSGLLAKTIVVVTSDHGESFGEHGYLEHGPRVDDAVMRVPLVLRLPKAHPAANPGRVVDALVRTVDILPTLLDAVGTPVPEGLDGISLLPAVRGESPPALWAYGEAGRSFMGMDPERLLPGVEGKHRMIRTAGWKLVFVPDQSSGEYRLFDLSADPGEHRNVAADAPAKLDELRAHLETILATDESAAPERSLSPEETETLRELGYIQ
jgi:arylsulfatase A-like enzyme